MVNQYVALLCPCMQQCVLRVSEVGPCGMSWSYLQSDFPSHTRQTWGVAMTELHSVHVMQLRSAA